MLNNQFNIMAVARPMGTKTSSLGGHRSSRVVLSVICHLLFVISCLSSSLSASAQQTFTEHLTRQVAGEGTVSLSQDAEIESLVNGTTPAAATARKAHPSASPDSTAVSGEAATPRRVMGHKTQTIGYRIQVYAGGNNRQSKSEAYRMAQLVRSYFSDINVYTSFISPRWVCRAGDFKTREEAVEQLRKMRLTQQFGEASIVKSKIIVTY